MLFSLIEGLDKTDIILASTSPRRYELLKSLGLEFKVVASKANEQVLHTEPPQQTAIYNAQTKGREVANRYSDALVISADTIVSLDDHILGKPADETDAFRMLQMLSGKTHQVYTGFCLIYARYELELNDVVSTDVSFRDLTEDEIWAYIGTGEPVDKAGAYAIQGQGAILVQQINGCYSNVVGFPLSRFFKRLEEMFGHLTL